MARITHPDTFKCDLCGDEMNENEVNRVVAPFASNYVATEYGLRLKDRLEYDSREFELCDACTWSVIVIRETGQRASRGRTTRTASARGDRGGTMPTNVCSSEGGFTCSECGAHISGDADYCHSFINEDEIRVYTTANEPSWNYCPNCGARIERGGE